MEMHLDIAAREMHQDRRGREQPETCGTCAHPPAGVGAACKQGRHGDHAPLGRTVDEAKAGQEAESGDADGMQPEQDENAAMASLPDCLGQGSALGEGGLHASNEWRVDDTWSTHVDNLLMPALRAAGTVKGGSRNHEQV